MGVSNTRLDVSNTHLHVSHTYPCVSDTRAADMFKQGQHPKSMTTTAMERSVEVVAEISPYPIVDMVVIDLRACVCV